MTCWILVQLTDLQKHLLNDYLDQILLYRYMLVPSKLVIGIANIIELEPNITWSLWLGMRIAMLAEL